MQLSEIMARNVPTIGTEATLQQAASEMALLDTDLLVVTDGHKLVGAITERDITLRATANGFDPKRAHVRCAMTTGVICECETHGVQQAGSLMTLHRLQQLPVLNRDHELVGMVSLTDLVHAIDTPGLVGPSGVNHVGDRLPGARCERSADWSHWLDRTAWYSRSNTRPWAWAAIPDYYCRRCVNDLS